MQRYDNNKYISRLDPTVDLAALLADAEDDDFIGDRLEAVHLSTWEAVDNFRQQQQIAERAKMVRGRVKEGKPRPR